MRTALSHIIDHFAFTVAKNPKEFITERKAINSYLEHLPVGGMQKMGYTVVQFFKAIFGYSDYQITKKTLRQWVFSRMGAAAEAESTARQVCKIFEAAAFDRNNIKNINTLNKFLNPAQDKGIIPLIPLEEPINFNNQELEILRKIINKETGVTYHNQPVSIENFGANIPVFTVSIFPGFIFKFDPKNPDSIPARYMAMLAAKQVIMDENLSSLSVPGAALLSFGNKDILVERKYPFKPGEEERSYELQETLKDPIRDLTVLICKTHFADVKLNNIPLVEIDGQMKVGLVDLEQHQSHSAIDGLVGWDIQSLGEETHGLIALFPHYADLIIETASQHGIDTSDERFVSLTAKAHKIQDRDKAIEQFHQERGLTAESPVLRDENIDTLDIPESDKALCKKIATDINAVIRKQSESHANLARIREWRLTTDTTTADSNWNENIGDNFRFILGTMIPAMIQKGLIHSVLRRNEAVEFGVDVRRRVGDYDRIVQF